MSGRTVSELLAASKESLDPVARDLVLRHLENAATAITMIAWQMQRCGAAEDLVRPMLELDMDLRRAYVKLGGYVHPAAAALYPKDEP